MRLTSFCIAFFLVSSLAFANSNCEEELVLFELTSNSKTQTTLKVNSALLSRIVISKPEVINFDLPISSTESIRLELFKSQIFAEDFKVTSSSGKSISAASVGVPYSGIVDGHKLASFLFLDDDLIGMYSENNTNYQVSKNLNGFYEVTNHEVEAFEMNCLTDDSEVVVQHDAVDYSSGFIQDKPIDVYIEVNYEFPQLRSAKINKLAMAVFNFNQTAQLFRNDEIIIRISEIFVWDTESPYGGGSKVARENPGMPLYLNRFKKERKSFNGDVAILFVEQSSYGTGIASKVGGLCGTKPSDKMAVTKTYWDYATEYPKHSRGYKMPAHELGHLFGSPHTYNCTWNGNRTNLDTCRGRGKNCKDSRVNYDNRQDSDYTIMSYCETKSDLLRGFGVQPGNRIRNFIANASCLTTESFWDETLVLHHLVESDHYETYNAKYKAATIHAFNEIKDNTTTTIVAKDAVYLKEGFIASEGSLVDIKINNDNSLVKSPETNYKTTVKSYSIDNVLNTITEGNPVESISVVNALGTVVKTISPEEFDYLDHPTFFPGFYYVILNYVDGSIEIRKK